MAHYKSLKDIISQDSWNGLDVGKAEIMSFINKKTDKPGLDPTALDTMLNSLSQKQKGDYKNYYRLKKVNYMSVEILVLLETKLRRHNLMKMR